MSGRGYVSFLLLTIAWLAGSIILYDAAYLYHLGSAIVWWGLIVMTLATGYYLIQEAPAARVTGWLRRDFALNLVLFLALLFAILDAASRFQILGLRTAGWTALAAAAIHPIAVDWPHLRHHRADPAGSPVPQYIPPACIAIDWTLAVILLGGLLLL